MRRQREPETATIEAITHDGRGIAAIDGKKVFVPGVLPGEQVRIVRRKFRRRYDEADLLDVFTASPDRVTPRCAVFGVCGGCALQHISVADQRAMKQKALSDSLQRIGGVTPEHWLEPLFTGAGAGENCEEGGWQYRRRARLGVRDVAAKGRVLVGFRERRTALVTDMHRCEIMTPPVDGLVDPLAELIGSLSVRSRLPQIEVAVADNAVELVFRVLDPPTGDDREKMLQFARTHDVQISLQPGGIESTQPLDAEASRDPLYYELPEFDVRIGFEANDFIQVNRRMNRLMVSAAVRLLELRESDRVLDLFCGIGNFSLPLARRSARVLGIEGEAAQVARATANARRNGITNCEFSCGDLAAVQGGEKWLRQGCDRLLLDPPRSGAEEVVSHMAAIGPSRVVYLSCHPATLARDAAVLVKTQGYRLEAAGIIDMFPHTAHAEAIAVFRQEEK